MWKRDGEVDILDRSSQIYGGIRSRAMVKRDKDLSREEEWEREQEENALGYMQET